MRGLMGGGLDIKGTWAVDKIRLGQIGSENIRECAPNGYLAILRCFLEFKVDIIKPE